VVSVVAMEDSQKICEIGALGLAKKMGVKFRKGQRVKARRISKA